MDGWVAGWMGGWVGGWMDNQNILSCSSVILLSAEVWWPHCS